MPPYLCAIAYDKAGCGIGNWKRPFEVAEVTELNLSLWSHFKEGNDIEAVSVRKGCTFMGYDKTDRSGDMVRLRYHNSIPQHDTIILPSLGGQCCPRVAASPYRHNSPITQLSPSMTPRLSTADLQTGVDRAS